MPPHPMIFLNPSIKGDAPMGCPPPLKSKAPFQEMIHSIKTLWPLFMDGVQLPQG